MSDSLPSSIARPRIRIAVWETVPRLANQLARRLIDTNLEVVPWSSVTDQNLQLLVSDLDDDAAERLVVSFARRRRVRDLRLAFIASRPESLEWMLRELGADAVFKKSVSRIEMARVAESLVQAATGERSQ